MKDLINLVLVVIVFSSIGALVYHYSLIPDNEVVEKVFTYPLNDDIDYYRIYGGDLVRYGLAREKTDTYEKFIIKNVNNSTLTMKVASIKDEQIVETFYLTIPSIPDAFFTYQLNLFLMEMIVLTVGIVSFLAISNKYSPFRLERFIPKSKDSDNNKHK